MSGTTERDVTDMNSSGPTAEPLAGSAFLGPQHPVAIDLKRRADQERQNLDEWSQKVQALKDAIAALMKVPGTDDMQAVLRQRLAQDKSALKFCHGRSEAYQHAYQIVTQRRPDMVDREPCPRCGSLQTYPTDYDPEGMPRGIGCGACGYDSDIKEPKP